MAGGQPMSIENLRGVRALAREHGVPLFLDATRLSENALFVKDRIGAHAVFLDAKRFLPHLPQQEFPAQALAAALYLEDGVRTMERGIVSGQHGDEPYDGLELVRLTIPRRVYTQEHLAYAAEIAVRVYEQRADLAGLRMTYAPEHLRFFQARFKPLPRRLSSLYRPSRAPTWSVRPRDSEAAPLSTTRARGCSGRRTAPSAPRARPSR